MEGWYSIPCPRALSTPQHPVAVHGQHRARALPLTASYKRGGARKRHGNFHARSVTMHPNPQHNKDSCAHRPCTVNQGLRPMSQGRASLQRACGGTFCARRQQAAGHQEHPESTYYAPTGRQIDKYANHVRGLLSTPCMQTDTTIMGMSVCPASEGCTAR